MWENVNGNISVLIGTYLKPFYMQIVTILSGAYLELSRIGSHGTIIFSH